MNKRSPHTLLEYGEMMLDQLETSYMQAELPHGELISIALATPPADRLSDLQGRRLPAVEHFLRVAAESANSADYEKHPDSFRVDMLLGHVGENKRSNERVFFNLPAGDEKAFRAWRERMSHHMALQTETMKGGWVVEGDGHQNWFMHSVGDSGGEHLVPLWLLAFGKSGPYPQKLGVKLAMSGCNVTGIALTRSELQKFIAPVGLSPRDLDFASTRQNKSK